MSLILCALSRTKLIATDHRKAEKKAKVRHPTLAITYELANMENLQAAEKADAVGSFVLFINRVNRTDFRCPKDPQRRRHGKDRQHRWVTDMLINTSRRLITRNM